MDERERLTGCCLTVMSYLLSDSADDQAFLKKYEAVPFYLAPISGLREAANDAVESAVDLQEQQVHELDRELLAEGFPSLSGVRDSKYRRLIRILHRGHIVSGSEWRELNGLAADIDSGVITDEERSKLGALLSGYESKG